MGKKASGSRTINSLKNLTTGFGGQLLSTVLRFVVRTVFIRTLGKSYLGINGLFKDILTMLSLTELGFGTAISYRLYKPLAQNDEKRVRVLMKFYKLAYRVIGFIILGIGVCIIPLLPALIKDYDKLAVLKINAVLIFVLHILRTVSSYWFFSYRSTVMRANQKKYILEVIGYFTTTANSIAEILILIFLKDFVLYTACTIVFNILANVIKAIVTQRYYPQFFIKEEDRLSREEVVTLLKDCMALFTFKVNQIVLKATDNMVISTFLGLGAVGLYSNYLLFFSTARQFLVRLYTAVGASMGNLFAVESTETKYKFFKVMNYLTMILYGTAGVGIAVCADEVLEVWLGLDYVVAKPLAILVGIEIIFNGLAANLEQIRTVSGVFRQLWFRPIITAGVNLVSSIILVQFIGLSGVVLGTITANATTTFMVDPWLIHKYSFQNYKPVSEYYKTNLLYCAILAAVAAFDFWVCGVFIVGHGWLSVIVHVLITGLSVPGVMLAIFRKTEECKYLVDMIRRIQRKITHRRAAVS